MLERWLETLPRPLLIGGGLILGLIVIVVFIQPPRHVCDVQFDVIKLALTPTVYLDEAKPYNRKGNVFVGIQECRSTNSPGGCLDLFDSLRRILKEVDNASHECSATLANDDTLKNALLTARNLIVELAWGTKPPISNFNKTAWMDLEHVDVFCRSVRLMRELYGDDEWAAYVNAKLGTLPGASTLPAGESWKRSIMSSCPK